MTALRYGRSVSFARVQQDVRFFAVVRDKEVIFRKVLEQNSKTPKYRYHPNQLYDRCVARLFRDRLHNDGSYAVYFSKRGSSNRTEAMQKALEQARANFRHKFQRESTAPIEILAAVPALSPGLQAVDYFLWALQRIYEHHEDRYWRKLLRGNRSLVHDVDDTRTADYGEYYRSGTHSHWKTSQKRLSREYRVRNGPHGMEPNFVPSFS